MKTVASVYLGVTNPSEARQVLRSTHESDRVAGRDLREEYGSLCSSNLLHKEAK